jgi:hypothetical protein
MSYANGTAAYGSTGIKTITTGFLPEYIRVTVSGLFGGGDTEAHISIGSGTPTKYHVSSTFSNGTNNESVDSASYVIYHMEDNGSGVVSVIEATIDSFNATNFKLNVGKASAAYNIYWEAFA